MSYEMAEPVPRHVAPTRRASQSYRGGLGATGILAIASNMIAAPTTVATAPWMQGLPRAGDSKDNTRIAYAKRDHDLAMPPRNDATAYANLKSQAVGSATAVGKAWYRAALADVDRARAAAAPAPAPVAVDPLYNRAAPPDRSVGWVWTAPNGPWVKPAGVSFFKPPVSVLIDPIVKQATDMGLKIQTTADGAVVAVDANGAVVSKPLPVSPSAVTDNAVVPANAVQANAPPPTSRTSGIFSIFDKLNQRIDTATNMAQNAAGSGSVASSGGASGASAPTDTGASFSTADMSGGGFGVLSEMLKNPAVLAAAGLAFYLLFASGSPGRRR